MEKMIKSQDAIFVMLSDLEQIEICKRKIAKTEKCGDRNMALNWAIKGLNIARSIKSESKIREFSNYILTMI